MLSIQGIVLAGIFFNNFLDIERHCCRISTPEFVQFSTSFTHSRCKPHAT